MIRIGLLGASKIAPKAIIGPAESRDDCIIQAVASRNADKAKAYAAEHNIPHHETSYEALISRDDVDLIYNALPPNRHCELTVLAAKHGKAVLCEKPFAMTEKEARKMVEAAEAAGKMLLEAFHYRFHPSFLDFEQIVRSGKLGEIESISGVFDVHIVNREGELRYLPRLGGGALTDLGCYPLHAMRLLTAREPKVVEAESDMHVSGVAVASWAQLDFDGIPGALACNMDRDAVYENSVQVIGTKGVAQMRGFVHPYRWDPHLGFDIYVEVGGTREVKTLHNSPDNYRRSTYDFQLDHVIEVMNGTADPLTGGQDAIANMAAIEAILAG